MDIFTSVYAFIIVAGFFILLLATLNYVADVFQKEELEEVMRSFHLMVAIACTLSIVIFAASIITVLVEGI